MTTSKTLNNDMMIDLRQLSPSLNDHDFSILPSSSSSSSQSSTTRLQFRLKHYKSPTQMSSIDLDQCYKLVRNIKGLYEGSGMGWDAKSKKLEMAQDELEYYVIYQKTISGSGENQKNTKKFEQQGIAGKLFSFLPKNVFSCSLQSNNNNNNRIGIPTENSPQKKRKLEDNIDNLKGENKEDEGENEDHEEDNYFLGNIVAFLSIQPRAPEYLDDDEEEEEKEEDDDNSRDIISDTENNNRKTSENLTTSLSSSSPSKVSYIYEIHCSKESKGLGMGKHLLEIAKRVCIEEPQSKKVMLTVFNINWEAQSFYLWNGFKYLDVNNNSNSSSRDEQQITSFQYRKQKNKPTIPGELSFNKKLHPDLRNQPGSRTQGWCQMIWIKP